MNAQQVIKSKNPLFSCAVTGGFEEFTGSGMVLQAAAEKPVFTIGTPAISDTDNFSDISLDPSTDATTTPSEPVGFYSPLAELDSMGNLDAPATLNLAQDHQQVDGNLNPISAALAQLPNAASTVFSTFSSIIKGSSTHLQDQVPVEQEPPANPYGFIYSENSDVNAPPPSFFSPTDDSLFKKVSAEPMINNTFRMGGNKKKTYALIPGLSYNQQQQQPTAQAAVNNVVMPPMPPQPEVANHFQEYPYQQQLTQPIMNMTQPQSQPTYVQKEPEKSKFSLTSLLPSQLLDKIPSTKNLFGLGDTAPSYDQQQQQSYNENFSVATNFDQPQNFFASQPANGNQLSNVYQGDKTQSAVQQAPINFFNPQQFVTSPFSQPKIAESQEVHGHGAFSSSEAAAPPPVSTFNFAAVQASLQPPLSSLETSVTSQFSEPPMMFSPTISQQTVTSPPTFGSSVLFSAPITTLPPTPSYPPVFAQNFNGSLSASIFTQSCPNDPPKIDTISAETNRPPPTFFNPIEASEMMKLGQVDDGKPKNPYSSSKISRGIGMYKTKAPNDTSSVQNVMMMPPMPERASSFQSDNQAQFPPVIEQQKIPSRPPSIPPLPTAGNYGQANDQIQQLPVSFPPPIVQQQNFEPMTRDSTKPPSFKKSDLNVPDQTSALNFFQSPSVVQMPPQTTPVESISQFNNVVSTPAFNFFQPEPSAPLIDNKDFETTDFFSNDHPKATQQHLEVTPSTIQLNETTSDIGDKIDSMSDNIGSTLSLFATSELDATSVQKSSAPFESLIPKFLDTQARSSPSPAPNKTYRPVYRHWFYQNFYWHPFAMSDSLALDDAISSGKEIVVTDGGRFEVDLKEKRRSSVYWSSGSNAIRRCSWFFKNPSGAESNLIPFDEAVADFMESEFEKAMVTNSWNLQLSIPDSDEFLVMKDSASIEYHQMGQVLSVKRGVDEFLIDDGEEAAVDHLILSISNFGDKIDDSADNLRLKCMETIQHYYSEAFDCGTVGRIEVLPISLNSVDVLKMKDSNATVEAAPGGNSDLMKSSTYQEVIIKTAFYCNHEYYQNIMNHLAFSLNETVAKFRLRNVEFTGKISFVATSFEALFLFDLLQVQDSSPQFWKLNFTAASFYAFGMPSSLLTIRNGHSQFEAKNCRKFLNVVHRLDPIAQRIEPLIKPEFSKFPPESIENEAAGRIDFTIADGSSLESFSLKNYFSSELIILRLTRDIYGEKMDSGSL